MLTGLKIVVFSVISSKGSDRAQTFKRYEKQAIQAKIFVFDN